MAISNRPKAVLSYAHGPSDAEIVALSDRLRISGVDCEVDAYENSPSKGWLQWMEDMMATRTVLAVCTADYAERLRGDAAPGVGSGAAWEGRLIKQRVYDAQGRNEGVVPIVFATADRQFIPPFLSDVTYYDLSEPDGFERLYNRLTRQAAHPRPPLGTMVRPASFQRTEKTDLSSWALFAIPGDGRIPAEVIELTRNRALTRVKARPTIEESRRFATLADAYGRRMTFSYRQDCYAGVIRDVKHTMGASGDEVTISIESAAFPVAGSITDMSYNGVSADEIASLRAHRILLNEALPERFRRDPLMESFVVGKIGSGSEVEVRRSNIPEISQRFENNEMFAAIARLDSVMQLTLSATVEHIEKLEIARSEGIITVDFAGTRSNVYSNREAPRIELRGVCAP